MNIPIYFKRSSVAGKSPETTGTSGIGYGEPAINYNKDNEALFFKNASNEIKTVPLDASVPYDKVSGLTNINEGLSSKKDAFTTGYPNLPEKKQKPPAQLQMTCAPWALNQSLSKNTPA